MMEERTVEEFKGTEVTKSHYKQKSDRKKCHNQSCRASFVQPSLKRPHHCKRCGEVFCLTCLRYKRRLNPMAQPDPNGVLCKVCLSCFEDKDMSSLGCTTRSHTTLFQQLRKESQKEIVDILQDYVVVSKYYTEQTTFWKEKFKVDILKECQRLLKGFTSSSSRFGTLNTLREIQSVTRIPSWQKSTFWKFERQASLCRYCGGELEHRKKKRNCRVCGLALCKACSHKELLLYYKDGTRHKKSADAHLSVIRFIGCPDREPQCSMLLSCCKECKEEIIRRQIKDHTWYMEKTRPPDVVSEIIRMDDEFRTLVEDIRDGMDQFDDAEETTSASAGIADEKSHAESSKPEVNTRDEELETVKFLQSRVQDKLKLFRAMYCVQDKLKLFRDMYWDLRFVIERKNDKLQGRTNDFVMNYASARNKFYIETKQKLGV